LASNIEEQPHLAAGSSDIAPWAVVFFLVAALCFVGAGLVFVAVTIF